MNSRTFRDHNDISHTYGCLLRYYSFYRAPTAGSGVEPSRNQILCILASKYDIWCLEATILMIFLRINLSDFVFSPPRHTGMILLRKEVTVWFLRHAVSYHPTSSPARTGVIEGRPHLLDNLPSSHHHHRVLYRCQIILLGDRGTWVWTTCLHSLRSSTWLRIETATFRSQIWRATLHRQATRSHDMIRYETLF